MKTIFTTPILRVDATDIVDRQFVIDAIMGNRPDPSVRHLFTDYGSAQEGYPTDGEWVWANSFVFDSVSDENLVELYRILRR